MIEQLVELRRHAADYLRHDGTAADDAYFTAEQNAVLVGDAEEYYRTMLGDAVNSWNLRDRHMADTLDHLVAHLDRGGRPSRVVVWAHNSHIGDARATQMGERGELNLGQLMRERHPGEVVLIGFATATGTVRAANAWGGAAARMQVRAPTPGSYEDLLHQTGIPAFLLAPLDAGDLGHALDEPRLERAIGVIYRPMTERQSHLFASRITRQFDALIHIDRTHAVEPLDRAPYAALDEPPETYPSAL